MALIGLVVPLPLLLGPWSTTQDHGPASGARDGEEAPPLQLRLEVLGEEFPFGGAPELRLSLVNVSESAVVVMTSPGLRDDPGPSLGWEALSPLGVPMRFLPEVN